LHGPLFENLPGLTKGEAAAPEARKRLCRWPPCPENFVFKITLIDYAIFLKIRGESAFAIKQVRQQPANLGIAGLGLIIVHAEMALYRQRGSSALWPLTTGL
jgi:hypothetical protein